MRLRRLSLRGSSLLRMLPLLAGLAGACEREPSAEPAPPPSAESAYHLVGARGALSFGDPGSAARGDATAPGAQRLLPGFGISLVEQRTVNGRRVGRTGHGRWLALADLTPPPAIPAIGVTVDGASGLNFAWVVAPGEGAFARVPLPAASRARDRTHDELRAPQLSARPPGVAADERWLDIALQSQTLVAYEGDRPVFATLVSTGIGQPPSPLATPVGTFRITVKYLTASMDNLEHTGVVPYSYEDIPLVQYFTDRVALHPASWHRRFGHPASHGCINVAPADARWLWTFTAPHLGSGLPQAFPSAAQPGTVVRIR